MKPLDWNAIRRAARNPEKRQDVRDLLQKAYTGRDMAASVLAQLAEPLEAGALEGTAVAASFENERAKQTQYTRTALEQWERDIARLELILRETAGERTL